MNTGSFLARQKISDKARKPDSGMCLYDEEDDALNHEDIFLLPRAEKQITGPLTTLEENPFDLVTP